MKQLCVLLLLWGLILSPATGSWSTLNNDALAQSSTASNNSQNISLDLTDEEKLYLDGLETLTFVCDPHWPPFDFIDDQGMSSGIAADYLKLFSNRIGISITLLPTANWTESLAIAKEGKCDLVSLLNKTPERTRYLDFTTPYFFSRQVIVAKDSVPSGIRLADMKGMTLAIIDGYKIEEDLQRDLPGVKMIKVQSSKEALNKVNNGEAYATVMTEIEAAHMIRTPHLRNMKICNQTIYADKLSLGVRKGDDILLSIMQKVVDSLTVAEAESIRDKWTTMDSGQSFDFSKRWKLFTFLALTLAVAFFVMRKTR